ncbi:MAG: MBL fold metallo-hydrolase, partial [Chitinophagaceae bacterium]
MKRSSFLKIGGLTFGALAAGHQQLLASLTQDPFTIKMLTPEIGVFTEKGGTILFYLSTEGMVVVDTEFPEQAKHLIAELNKKNDKGFKLLINTHHHGDHTGGNIEFKGMVPQLLAHVNSLKNQRNVAEAQKSSDKQYFPDKTFTDSHVEKVGSETIRFHYFGPAHTDGDALIHFEKANIVHMG